MDALDKFLQELTALTDKHGFVIRGCGCCGSPSVQRINKEDDKGPYFLYERCGEEGGDELTYAEVFHHTLLLEQEGDDDEDDLRKQIALSQTEEGEG